MAGIVNDSIGGMGGGLFNNNGGVIEGLLFGALLGNGFDGNKKDCGSGCCEKMIDMHDHHNDHDHTVDAIGDCKDEINDVGRQMGDYAMGLQQSICGVDKDVLESKYDLATQILNNRFESALQGKDIIREIDLQTCGINRNVDEVKFNQAIFAKEAQAQLAACCCELSGKIRDSIDATNKAACDTQMLIITTDAKNDAKEAERERRELERQIDCLTSDKRVRDSQDNVNVLNNFGTIANSLNSILAALGNTAA